MASKKQSKISVDEAAAEEVNALVDKLGDPKKMSKREYVDFLRAVISDCESKADATEEELEAEG